MGKTVAATIFGTLLFAALLTGSGCSVNPVTGENEISLVSPQQEVALGEQNYLPMRQSQGGDYNVDPALEAYVSNIGLRLAAVSDRPNLPWEFRVVNNTVPNAWALPGGKIAVNRGLLLHLDNEAELAAVLGHEVVHAAARHSAAQMTRGTLVGMTAQIATIAAQTQGYGELGNMAAQVGSAAFMAKYGRDDELEADKYGMKYMSRAGYEPEAAVTLQETFVELSAGQRQDFISGLFASHPPSQGRVDANRERAAGLPSGKLYRERYQQNIAQLKKVAPAYKAQEKALAALEKKDARGALALLDTSIAIAPNEAQFWEMRGHAWSMLDNPDNADTAYSTAIRKNPQLFSPKLYRGLLRYKKGNHDSAFSDLSQSYRLLPTPVAAYYLGEISMSQGMEEQALAYYSQATSSSSEELAGQAQQKVALLEISQAPHKYIASKAYLGNDGYIYVAVQNNSQLAVRNVSVQLVEMTNAFTQGRAQTLPLSLALEPGARQDIKTGIGPFQNKNDVPDFRSLVINAEVAQ